MGGKQEIVLGGGEQLIQNTVGTGGAGKYKNSVSISDRA